MGWCAEFGTWIDSGCGHAMVAGAQSCRCQDCGVVCSGRFAACKDVWAAGPRPRGRVATTTASSPPADSVSAPRSLTNGAGSKSADDRLRHLDATVARMADDLQAVQRKLGNVNEVTPAGDDRLLRVEERLDSMARNLVEALSLMRTLPPALEAQQCEIRVLGQRVTELGQELQDIQSLAAQQQTVLDKLIATQGSSPPVRLDEILRRIRPAPAPGPDRPGSQPEHSPLPPLLRRRPPLSGVVEPRPSDG